MQCTEQNGLMKEQATLISEVEICRFDGKLCFTNIITLNKSV